MKKFTSFILVCLFAVSFASAHRGRTDAQGGHYDTNNESGLGSYHYHHGYEAHLHENGVCPYETSTTPEPTAPAEPEPQQTEPTQSQQQPLLEPVSEEDIDYSQFESLEEAYQSGYFYALYHQYSNLYEESEDKSKLESLLNLGILTNLYFRNSKITYAQPTSEGFTNEDAFEEGKVQGSDDLENALSEYENSDFYTDNEIYKAGYDAATGSENIDTSGAEQAAYQEGYKKGVNDTKAEYETDEQDSSVVDIILVIIFVLDILAIAFIIYILQQLFFRLDEKYQSTVTRALMWIFTVLMIITIIPYIIACILFRFYNWQMERNKRYAEEEQQLLLKHYEMYKKGQYLPQIWEFEEFRKNGWME